MLNQRGEVVQEGETEHLVEPPASRERRVPRPRRSTVLYFEDVEMDVPLETPGITLTETHVALFAGSAGTGRRDPGAVPELLPLCLSSGLGWRVPQPPLVVLAFMGFEWRFLQPVAGRRHHPQRLADASPSARCRRAGSSSRSAGILNQRGEIVQSGRLTLLVAKRPAA